MACGSKPSKRRQERAGGGLKSQSGGKEPNLALVATQWAITLAFLYTKEYEIEGAFLATSRIASTIPESSYGNKEASKEIASTTALQSDSIITDEYTHEASNNEAS